MGGVKDRRNKCAMMTSSNFPPCSCSSVSEKVLALCLVQSISDVACTIKTYLHLIYTEGLAYQYLVGSLNRLFS